MITGRHELGQIGSLFGPDLAKDFRQVVKMFHQVLIVSIVYNFGKKLSSEIGKPAIKLVKSETKYHNT